MRMLDIILPACSQRRLHATNACHLRSMPLNCMPLKVVLMIACGGERCRRHTRPGGLGGW